MKNNTRSVARDLVSRTGAAPGGESSGYSAPGLSPRTESKQLGKALRYSFAGLAIAPALLGCGAEPGQMEDSVSVESAIIGGSAVSVATRRSLGLVDVNNGCSGSLAGPHVVITATHCLNLSSPSSNSFSIPRTDAGSDTRFGSVVSRVGNSDISVVQLQAASAGMMWPSLSHSVLTNPTPSALVGQFITCYGRGNNAYVSPSGTTGFGPWRQVTRPVAGFDGADLTANSVNGNDTIAPGDSGGPCYFNNNIAGVNSHLVAANCTDNTTGDTCKATLTKIISTAMRSPFEFADYINFSGSRSATTFTPITLAAGWTNAPFNTNLAGVNLTSSIVQLRGAIATTGTDAVAFTLPAGFRPSSDVYAPVNLCGGSKGRLYIQPSGVTTVQAEGGTWSNAQCFTSLEGVSFPTTTFASVALTLQNGWTNAPFGTRNAGVRKISNIVHLEGAIASGSNSTVFTLPAGFRPSTVAYVPVDLCNATKGRLVIQPSGAVSIQTEGDFSNAQCFTSLESATFATTDLSPLTPLNGWTGGPFSTHAPAFSNIGGIIRFQGAISSAGTNPTALLLPNGSRPATSVYIPIDLCGTTKGRIVVQPDGFVSVQSNGPFSNAQCFSSLDGASFGL